MEVDVVVPAHPKLADFATAWRIPPAVTGQKKAVRIGGCVYSRYPGVFAYVVYDELNAYGLQEDGTWNKYGHDFGTPEAAFEALLSERTVRR